MATIGYAGASLTDRAVKGYAAVGGTKLWPLQKFESGTLWRWLKVPSYLEQYDAAMTANLATDRIWWQLCMHDDDLNGTNPNADYPLDTTDKLHALTLQVLSKLSPIVPVYVSGMAAYSPESLCANVSLLTITKMQAEADRLVDLGLCLRGPVMPVLTAREVVASRIGCHQSGAGQRSHGKALLQFFG